MPEILLSHHAAVLQNAHKKAHQIALEGSYSSSKTAHQLWKILLGITVLWSFWHFRNMILATGSALLLFFSTPPSPPSHQTSLPTKVGRSAIEITASAGQKTALLSQKESLLFQKSIHGAEVGILLTKKAGDEVVSSISEQPALFYTIGGFSGYSHTKTAGIPKITGALPAQLSTIAAIRESLHVDLITTLSSFSNREEAIDTHLRILKNLGASAVRFQEQNSADITSLDTEAKSNDSWLSSAEKEYFTRLDNQDPADTDRLLTSFIKKKQQNDAVKAELGKRKKLNAWYDNLLPQLQKRIALIEANKSALEADVQITMIGKDALGLIKTQ